MLFFFKQKTAYELRISDWISDVVFRSLGGFDLVEELFADDALGQAFRLAATRLLRARGSPPGAAWRRFHRTMTRDSRAIAGLRDDATEGLEARHQATISVIAEADTSLASAAARAADRKSTRLNSSQ